MRRMYLTAVALALALGGFLCGNAAAQSAKWSLGECIEYALEHNLDIRQQQITVENRDINLQTSKLSRLPSLSASLNETVNIGRGQNRYGIYENNGVNSTSIGATASVPVFQGFKINNRVKSDKLSLEASMQDLEQVRQDLSLMITGFYLQVLYSLEEEELARNQVAINEDLVERTRKMVEAGKTARSELYNAESALAQAASNLLEAENDVSNAILDLTQSMNYADFSHFGIISPDIDAMVSHEALMLTPVDSICNYYLERRPSVMAAGKRVEQAKKEVKVAQSAYWPSINIGASYGTGYYSSKNVASGQGTFWDQLGNNGTTSIGASMTIPIFNRMSTRNSVRIAKNDVRTRQIALEQVKLNAFKEVQHAYVNAKGAFAKYQAMGKSVEAAQKAFEFEQNKFDSGRSNAYQYNEVRSKLESAQSQLSQAKYNFLLRAKILDFYKGEPLY